MTGLIGKILALGLVLGTAATACSSGGGASPPAAPAQTTGNGGGYDRSGGGGSAGTMTIDGQQANDKGSEDVTGASKAEIEADTDGGLNYFKPTVVTGTPGQKVTFTLKNESSSVPHNFTLEDQNINVDLNPGGEETVTVTFPQSGTLEFHCEYHAASGMIGELKVA